MDCKIRELVSPIQSFNSSLADMAEHHDNRTRNSTGKTNFVKFGVLFPVIHLMFGGPLHGFYQVKKENISTHVPMVSREGGDIFACSADGLLAISG